MLKGDIARHDLIPDVNKRLHFLSVGEDKPSELMTSRAEIPQRNVELFGSFPPAYERLLRVSLWVPLVSIPCNLCPTDLYIRFADFKVVFLHELVRITGRPIRRRRRASLPCHVRHNPPRPPRPQSTGRGQGWTGQEDFRGMQLGRSRSVLGRV